MGYTDLSYYTTGATTPPPTPAPQFIQVNTEAAPCPSGYSQVADLATCNAAATALIAAGQATQMSSTGDWVNHVGGCFEGTGTTGPGGKGNGNVHFSTRPVSYVPTQNNGYRYCKLDAP